MCGNEESDYFSSPWKQDHLIFLTTQLAISARWHSTSGFLTILQKMTPPTLLFRAQRRPWRCYPSLLPGLLLFSALFCCIQGFCLPCNISPFLRALHAASHQYASSRKTTTPSLEGASSAAILCSPSALGTRIQTTTTRRWIHSDSATRVPRALQQTSQDSFRRNQFQKCWRHVSSGHYCGSRAHFVFTTIVRQCCKRLVS